MTDTRNYEQGAGESGRRSGARQRGIDAYGGARGRVSGAGRRATETFDEAPLIALGAGLAAGALIAALLPRTRTEERLLRPVTDKVGDKAREAAQAAKGAGQSRLDELGLTPERGIETIRAIIQGAGDAARSSAQAALGTVRSSDTPRP
jgi:hypothetical protein